MNNILKLVILIQSFCVLEVNCQSNYWVYFKDKQGCKFNPYEYFDQKAIDRRIKLGISLYDSTDFPINSSYFDAIEKRTIEIVSHSRWFNSIGVFANEFQIAEIERLSFVQSTEKMNCYEKKVIADKNSIDLLNEEISLIRKQLASMNGKEFYNNNISGKGIRVAIFDAGFANVDEHEAFEHLHMNNKIIKTWDFVRDKDFVYGHDTHGTAVLSCMAGVYDGLRLGLATDAEYLLARTERNGEPFSEEKNWLMAIEWADKNGVDIVNSSLGYTHHRYFKEDMDGKKSLVARAGNLAARKGILVVNSMGNEGDIEWKTLGAPADADSVLTVGGIDPETGIHIDFSSYGPTKDKRMKPNVAAYGSVIAANRFDVSETQGTSFSSPLVAGFAACAWQAKPELTNMELFEEIQKSAHLYPYFDYAHGYGIPQADYFINGKPEAEETFDFKIENDSLKVIVFENFIEPINTNGNILYCKISDKNGYIIDYKVIEVFAKEATKIYLNDLDKRNTVIEVHYKGFTKSYEIDEKL